MERLRNSEEQNGQHSGMEPIIGGLSDESRVFLVAEFVSEVSCSVCRIFCDSTLFAGSAGSMLRLFGPAKLTQSG